MRKIMTSCQLRRAIPAVIVTLQFRVTWWHLQIWLCLLVPYKKIACLYPIRNCLLVSSIYRNRWVEQRGPNITGQGIGLALQPGRYTIRLVKEYKWREQPTVQYSYYSKEKGIHGKLRRRIWVSRAYWVISRNDLQIFFFERATIFSHTVEDSKENLFWRVLPAFPETYDLWDIWLEWCGDIKKESWPSSPLQLVTPCENWWHFWQLRTTDQTFFVTLQLRVTLDSIPNSCDVL